jgi:hypothetical protein
MAKQNNWEAVLIGVFSVLMGIIAFALSGSIFNLLFVPIVIVVLFDYNNKLNDVQQKLSDLESRLIKGSPSASGPS